MNRKTQEICKRMHTRFEKARIIAHRIKQLEKGSQPLVKIPSYEYLDVAMEEYRRGKLRHLKIEIVKIK